MKKRILLAALAVCLSLSACAGNAPDAKDASLKIAGSTSVAPLMKELKAAYESNHADIFIEIQQSGSSAGITAVIEGAAQIGMSSRDLSGSELSKGLVETPVALDGIAVIVNPANPVKDFTKSQITAIYKGVIKNWSELGGADGEIIVTSREEGSGTRGAFEELLNLEESFEQDGEHLTRSLLTKDALYENSTGSVKSGIAGSKNAIGYISIGTLDESVAAVSVDGAACTGENVKSGAYPVSRPFLICVKGEPDNISKDFIDFILSGEGQKIVTESGYISID